MSAEGLSSSAVPFAVHPVSIKTVSPESAESPAGFWSAGSAIAGYRVSSLPAGAAERLSSLVLTLWPLLANGAIEVRWIATGGVVSCYLLLRVTAATEKDAANEVTELAASCGQLAQRLVPGWTLSPLGEGDLDSVVHPFDFVEVGDLLRSEQVMRLPDGRDCDVPALIAVDASELGLLVQQMAMSAHPIMLSLAAAPTEIDEEARALLLDELAAVEQAVIETSFPESARLSGDDAGSLVAPNSAFQDAAETLRRRVLKTDWLGHLRLSLASSAPLHSALIAAAQDALSATALSLEWFTAAEQKDRETCSHNIEAIAFTPWGVRAADDALPDSLSDCYLASVQEIVSELAIPAPDGFLPLGHELLDPAPLPAPLAAPAEGRVVGKSLVGGRTVALSQADRLRHTYIVGQTGTGKSTLLLNLALQDIHEGKGVCVLDPHGDLVDGIVDRFPPERAEDLILFDPSDAERPVPINLLEANTPEEQDFVIQQMIGMIYRIYDPGHTGIVGPRFENMFRNAALVAMANPEGGTLLDLARLFTSDTFLAEHLKHVTDPAIRSFWIDEQGQTSDFHKSEVLGWFTSKFGAFASNRFMRAVVGQRVSAFSARDVMDSGKVLLVKLPRGVLGEINALWLGLIFIVKLQMAALSRGDVAPEQRREFNLYVDEFQNFAMTDFDALVAEARKYGLALTLAHQHVDQLTPQLRSAIFGNVASWVMFRLGMPDATIAAGEIERYSARDLTRLANYRCVVRTSVNGNVLPPFDLVTSPPAFESNPEEKTHTLKQLSRLKYGRSLDLVEAEYRASWETRPQKSDPQTKSAEQAEASGPDSDAESTEVDFQTILGPSVFGESDEIREGRKAIERLLRRGKLDEAIAAFKELFIKTDYSPDCWPVLDDMEEHCPAEQRAKCSALRSDLETMVSRAAAN